VIELRERTDSGTAPLLTAEVGDELSLASGGRARLLEPYRGSARLWIAELVVPGGVLAFADRQGQPIRYRYVPEPWPLSDYQTVFATEPGSAEMPSAGRPFTPAAVDGVRRSGVRIAPLVPHTGVASLEGDELPYPERYRVARATADAVNAARDAGGRVIAVGTTVVRALETVASPLGRVHPGAGWTDLMVTSARGVRAVDGILTGLHEPTSTHLAMLEAFAGRAHLDAAYRAALDERYLWHEFGDVHLLLR
jgi:S-adenosylmethionine:tRNA ribosyltransferase-isomerase